MIERYSSPMMREVWSDQAKWDRWKRVELAVMRARRVPLMTIGYIDGFAHDNPSGIAYFEERTGHDFVAWLRAWAVGADPDKAGQVHFGLTSSDVVDTALGLAVQQAGGLVLAAADELCVTLGEHAREHADTLRVARTHGRPAEVSSWGLLVADVARAAVRARRLFSRSKRGAERCMISGPAGTYAELGVEVEMEVAHELGLDPVYGSTQVVERGAVADLAYSLVALATVCERFATQVRLGARDGELVEGRSLDQVGSSSMPQKRNPVRAEKIVGLARVARGQLAPLLESVALWDERDISHSSVERIALPDLFAVTEHILGQTTQLVRELHVDAPAMRSLVFAEYVDLCKHWALCRMIEAGWDRWEAHTALQDVHLAAELCDLVGRDLPDPWWFLRNARLDKEASAMV